MTMMRLIVSVAILVLGAATLGSAQWRHQNGYTYQQYYPQQHRPYQNQYPKGQTGVSTSEAEWVCKNPKTGDMMIIVSEDVPTGNGQGQWQQQRPPSGQPVQPSYPSYPQQPNYPQPQPNYPPPTYPTQPPTGPTYPTQPPTGPTYPTTQPPNQGTPPSNGGEGVIDIRFGEK